jgi:hypothetical protein
LIDVESRIPIDALLDDKLVNVAFDPAKFNVLIVVDCKIPIEAVDARKLAFTVVDHNIPIDA